MQKKMKMRRRSTRKSLAATMQQATTLNWEDVRGERMTDLGRFRSKSSQLFNIARRHLIVINYLIPISGIMVFGVDGERVGCSGARWVKLFSPWGCWRVSGLEACNRALVLIFKCCECAGKNIRIEIFQSCFGQLNIRGTAIKDYKDCFFEVIPKVKPGIYVMYKYSRFCFFFLV